MPEFAIRNAVVEDAERLIELMRELARYERLEHLFQNDVDGITEWLFGPDRCATAHVAWVDGNLVGYSISFRSYSTFLGKPGMWLEDLFVSPEHRGKGIGKALLTNLARECTKKGYLRLEWAVLDWNQPAIDFYGKIGAQIMPDWRLCRLSGETLDRCAGREL